MHSKIIAVLCIALFYCSCSGGFSKGIKKDLSTGLTATYNGFALEDIYLSSNDSRLSSNQVTLGDKVSIMASGVNNFTEKEGKVFPGCTIVLTDTAGKELLNLPDAFADMVAGTTKDQATTLRAQLNTGDPMVAGATYHLKARFFDKNNAASEIVANADITMK